MKNKAAKYEQILLMGCDINQNGLVKIGDPIAEEDRCQRSDAMVVLSLDKTTGRVKLVDLFRDVWVPIPGCGMGKLNEVVVRCGPKETVRLVNEKFRLCIRRYVQVSVTGLVELVDLLGGVDVKLTAPEVHYINGRMPEIMLVTGRNEPFPTVHTDGWNRLCGLQALAHARNRTIGQIVGRENRINDVLKAMARRIKEELRPHRRLAFLLALKKYVRTDLSLLDILRLLPFFLRTDPDTIPAYHAPAEGTFTVKSDGTWRIEVNFDLASEKLWNYLERPD